MCAGAARDLLRRVAWRAARRSLSGALPGGRLDRGRRDGTASQPWAEGTRYPMREKMLAIGDDFWIETEGGEKAFKVNGKALRIRDTLVLESPSGEEAATTQRPESW